MKTRIYMDRETGERMSRREWIRALAAEARDNSGDAYAVTASYLFRAMLDDGAIREVAA